MSGPTLQRGLYGKGGLYTEGTEAQILWRFIMCEQTL